jgi:hypothetical protein
MEDMEDIDQDEFDEMIQTMEKIADYDAELVMNTVLDNYQKILKIDPKLKPRLHKFLVIIDVLKELTIKQRKIIKDCVDKEMIENEDIQMLLDMNVEKEETLEKALKVISKKKAK